MLQDAVVACLSLINVAAVQPLVQDAGAWLKRRPSDGRMIGRVPSSILQAGHIGVTLGLYEDILGVVWGHNGIMESKMESTI